MNLLKIEVKHPFSREKYESETAVRICVLGEVRTGPKKRDHLSGGFRPQPELVVFMDRFGHANPILL